jgi:hypothetical protein
MMAAPSACCADRDPNLHVRALAGPRVDADAPSQEPHPFLNAAQPRPLLVRSPATNPTPSSTTFSSTLSAVVVKLTEVLRARAC